MRLSNAPLRARYALLATVAVMASPALAQTSETTSASPASTAASTDEGGSDIVVTAQRREQNLQDVPISMEVLSGERMAQLNANDFKDAVNYLPNVFVQSTAGNDTIYIRGFGSPPANFAFDQSVSMYLDGIYAGRVRQAMAPFFDIQRVEVMRGPQGALYGKNTPAGAISIVSAQPTNRPEMGLTALYNFNLEGPQVSAYASGPLTDTLSARLAFQIRSQDGYIHNLRTGNEDASINEQLVRGILRWEPSSNFDYTLKAEYGHRDQRGGLTVSSPVGTPQRPVRERYTDETILGPEGVTAQNVNIAGNGNLSLGDFTVQSVTGYSWFKSQIINGFDQNLPGGGIAPLVSANAYPERFRQFSQEFRLLSPTGGTLEYVVGAYYDHAKYNMQLRQFNTNGIGQQLATSHFDQTSETWSVFGQATLRLAEVFRVIGSLRYTHTTKDAAYSAASVGPVIVPRPLTTATGSRTDSNLDPSVTVQFDATDDIMLYASFGRGSKSGGFVSNTWGVVSNPTSPSQPAFEFNDERSRNYEAGIKATLFDRMVNFSAAYYNTRFSDLQVSFYRPSTSSYFTGNAATATSQGVEAQLSIRPTRNFDITATGAYQDLQYDRFDHAPCLVWQGPACYANPNNSLAGVRPALASKWMGSVQAHGRFELGDSMALDLTGTASGRTRFYNSDDQSPLYGVQRGFVKYDARIQLGDIDNRWHVALVGRNLSNELTTGSAFQLPASLSGTGVGRAMLYVDPPRNIALEAGFRF